MKSLQGILLFVILAVMAVGCEKVSSGGLPAAAPSMYYWRTSWQIDSAEQAFLDENGVKKIYLRLFDVVVRDGKCVPSATISFNDTLADTLRVIPTIFITEECLRADTVGLAMHIVERVGKMCATHRLPNVCELQLDCDWTPSSREAYYALLNRVRNLLRVQNWQLSATIRLHQLSQPAPPVDYGVLMLYNTGDMRRRDSRNPIFATEDVEPYLKNLKSYDLPLCAAYPNYRWQRLFSGERFKGLLYSENLRDSTVYEPLAGDSLYRVVQGRVLHGVLQGGYDVHLSPGDEVVVSRPNADEVMRLAHRLEDARPGLHAQTIFYHLDSHSLKNYNTQQYEALFHLH